jgi:hypothetical protein
MVWMARMENPMLFIRAIREIRGCISLGARQRSVALFIKTIQRKDLAGE